MKKRKKVRPVRKKKFRNFDIVSNLQTRFIAKEVHNLAFRLGVG